MGTLVDVTKGRVAWRSLLIQNDGPGFGVSLGVFAGPGTGPRFSVLGDHASHCGDYLPALLVGGFDGVGINALQAHGIGAVDASGRRIILAVEFAGPVDLDRVSLGVHSDRIKDQAARL